MQSFIYVIGPKDGQYVKIGHSRHPEKRLKQLQTGHSEKLFLWHSEPILLELAKAAEKTIHQQIGFKRRIGEWFAVGVEDAIAEVRFGVMSY